MSDGQPTVVDLFCGAGGFSLGFSASGFRVVLGVDNDAVSGETFRRNFAAIQPQNPPAVLAGVGGDLESTDLQNFPCDAPDVLVAGPPCQGFSRVGRAKLNALAPGGFHADPRNDLYLRFLDAAETLRPRAVVMENVQGMLQVNGVGVANVAAGDLVDRGYRVGYAVLNAAWYGVPQFRERFFMVGIRDDLGIRPSMPPATHGCLLPSGYVRPLEPDQWTPSFAALRIEEELPVDLRGAMQPATTVREALDDLPRLTEHLSNPPPQRGDFRREMKYSSEPRSEYARLMRAWPGLLSPHAVQDHAIRRTPRDYETFRLMSPGDRYPEALDIAECRFEEALASRNDEGSCPAIHSPEYEKFRAEFVPPYPRDRFVDKWKKLVPEEPSWTVPAHLSRDSYSHIHYDGEQARGISIREAARLQSFPDAFVFEGNMGDCFRQIGNAVPPVVAAAIACEIRKCLRMGPSEPLL